MAAITSFSINGLHGVDDFHVPVKDGKVILVGFNGLGKTTIVSMLYYVLTRQWGKLSEYEFDSVAVGVGGENISIARSMLDEFGEFMRNSYISAIPESVQVRLRGSRDFAKLLGSGSFSRDDITKISKDLSVPASYLERVLMMGIHPGTRRQRRKGKNLQEIENKLSALSGQVLYLPTYRRIEQDLKSLFPEFEGDFKRAVRQRVARDTRAEYVELVEFGMEDVEARVNAKVAALKEGSRLELNNLAGSYLRDVVRGEAREWSEEKINQLPDDEVRLILGRVEEKQLDERDKGKIFEVINRIRVREPLDGDQDLLAHFFSKLVNIHEIQRASEVPLRQFIQVCNKYLQAKKFAFDDVAYRLTLDLDRGGEIEMRGLSSGEKQIVSLFAQIYLGDSDTYSLIIDEPELSLSVEWQKTLLPDIVKSGRCSFMAAVTHSPFIYDNELFSYTQDLAALRGGEA